MHIVTYLIECLGEFEFIFKTIVDYESGDQMGSFDAKENRHRKSHAWAPLRVPQKSHRKRHMFRLKKLHDQPLKYINVKNGKVSP
jgi:hypothetical protein